MDVLLTSVFSLIVTALILFGGMMIALFVGNLSGAVIRKLFGIGGK